MSEFDWRLFDRIHPSTKSVMAALTAPTEGKTRPALKWAAAVATVTAVAAAVALLFTVGPLGKSPAPTPPVGSTVPAEGKTVAMVGDYPITDKEMTAYMLDRVFSGSGPGTGEAAARACVRSKIAREEITGTAYDRLDELQKEAQMYAADSLYSTDGMEEKCLKSGVDPQEYIDCVAYSLMNNRTELWHFKLYCDNRGIDYTARAEAEYARYMDERVSQLEYHWVDDVFLTEVQKRMREIITRLSYGPEQAATDLFNQAYSKLHDGWYADAQIDFHTVVEQYPDFTDTPLALAYEQFCLALRLWNGDTSADQNDLDLTVALPAIRQAAAVCDKWWRGDGAPIFFGLDVGSQIYVEGDKLIFMEHEVQFHSVSNVTLIGGELAGDYVPYVDKQLGPVAVDRITVVYADILDPAAVWPYGNVIYRKDQLYTRLYEIEEVDHYYATDRQVGDHPSLRQQVESYDDSFFWENILIVAVVKGKGDTPPAVEQVIRHVDRFDVVLQPYEDGDQGYFIFIEADHSYGDASEVDITPATPAADPTQESQDDLERRTLIRDFVEVLARHDGEALHHFVGSEEIAAKLAGLELSNYNLKSDLPSILTLQVTGGAFGPIPPGESEWYIDGINTYHWHAALCPVEEDPTLRWYDQQEDQIPEFRFCHQIISELGLFNTVADYSRLSPAWYGERGNFLANVYANLYKNQQPLVHGEDVAAEGLTAFIQRAFGVEVTDFTGSRDYAPGDEVIWLSHLSGLYSNCGLVDHKTKGDIHTLTLQYFADYTRLIPAVTLECSIRDLGGGEYRMLSSKVTEKGDYPPLCEAF